MMRMQEEGKRMEEGIRMHSTNGKEGKACMQESPKDWRMEGTVESLEYSV
jgi:hypothetical protein